ncbi:ATP binding protein [Aureococcus anophagefferens]|nr:ATP binding protein [Aureococcus anophagefferens]
MSRERQRLRVSPNSKEPLAFRAGPLRESFCTPPTLQLPESPGSRSARVRNDASERLKREKQRLSLGSTPVKAEPMELTNDEKENRSSMSECSGLTAPKLSGGSRWSSASRLSHLLEGGSFARADGSWVAALNNRCWEEEEEDKPLDAASVAPLLVDKMVWVPVGAARAAAKVRCVLEVAGGALLGVELVTAHELGGDGTRLGKRLFDCAPQRSVFAAPEDVSLLTFEELVALPPPCPPPPRESQSAAGAGVPPPDAAARSSSSGSSEDPSPLLPSKPVPDWARVDDLADAVRLQAAAPPPEDLLKRALLPSGYRETGDWSRDGGADLNGRKGGDVSTAAAELAEAARALLH